MKKTNFKSLTTVLTVILISISAVHTYAASRSGFQKIHFIINDNLRDQLPSNFQRNIFSELEKALTEIKFQLTPLDLSIRRDSLHNDELVLYLTSTNENSSDFAVDQNLNICLFTVRDWISGNTERALAHPLISIQYQADEIETFQSVLVTKIAENIRTQYVCHLRIQSDPGAITILTNSGLEGKTPLEWIVPVGDLTIKSNVSGYEPFQKRINLNNPGIHTYFLELKKKQFYHSKFMYPTILGVLASGAFLFGEQYYYNKYHDYGITETKNNPEKFQKTFKKAQIFETAFYTALACTAVSFTMTFVFK